jgi:predicted permease
VNYAQLLFPDFSLILCGFLLCRYTALNRSVWQQVESLVYYLLFPVLLFHSIVKSPLNLGEASGLLMAGVLMGLAGIGLSYALPWLPGIGRFMRGREHPASVQVAFRFLSSRWPWPTAWPAPRACC